MKRQSWMPPPSARTGTNPSSAMTAWTGSGRGWRKTAEARPPAGLGRHPRTCRRPPLQADLHRSQLRRPRGGGRLEPPVEPVLFSKATSAWSGSNDDLLIPRHSAKTDWEVELAFVIGKHAKHVAEEDAMTHIAGFAVHNDYSECMATGGHRPVGEGKSADTFAPLAPTSPLLTKCPIPAIPPLAQAQRRDPAGQQHQRPDLLHSAPRLRKQGSSCREMSSPRAHQPGWASALILPSSSRKGMSSNSALTGSACSVRPQKGKPEAPFLEDYRLQNPRRSLPDLRPAGWFGCNESRSGLLGSLRRPGNRW